MIRFYEIFSFAPRQASPKEWRREEARLIWSER